MIKPSISSFLSSLNRNETPVYPLHVLFNKSRLYQVLDAKVDLLQRVVLEDLNGRRVLLVIVERLVLRRRDAQT